MFDFKKLKSRIGVFISSNNSLVFRYLRLFLQYFYSLFSRFHSKKINYSLDLNYLHNFNLINKQVDVTYLKQYKLKQSP